MSALAVLLLDRGHTISGSDSGESDQTKALEALGIPVQIGHKNLPLTSECVVINGAIGQDNPELLQARAENIPVIDRSELLATVSKSYKNIIAVAGTSGKSTTTAMIGEIFREAGLKPTVHNGAVATKSAPSIKYNPYDDLGLEIGENEYFITEACEFKRSFLTLSPSLAVITNIRPDHMNCYRDFDDLQSTFAQFISQSKSSILGEHVQRNPKINLQIPGEHNLDNASLALQTALHFGIDEKIALDALANFKGLKRRFEHLGTLKNTKNLCACCHFLRKNHGMTQRSRHILSATSNICTSCCEPKASYTNWTHSNTQLFPSTDIISDYAHHPDEIKTTIKTTKDLYRSPLFVFQPHTYTRTKTLFPEFIQALRGDQPTDVILYKTYSARENPIPGGKAEDLADALNVPCFQNETHLINFIKKCAHRFDAIVFTGAGDIDTIARKVI